jgi:hypothetical protein
VVGHTSLLILLQPKPLLQSAGIRSVLTEDYFAPSSIGHCHGATGRTGRLMKIHLWICD